MKAESDGIIELLINFVEAFENEENVLSKDTFYITVTTGGLLVSGRIISRDEFMSSHPLSARLEDLFNEIQMGFPEEEKKKDNRARHFIHLEDTHFFTPGQSHTPTKGTFWRGRLSEISGFYFGRLDFELS